MSRKHIPEGSPTIVPYLVVPGVPKLIDFLERTFQGTVEERLSTPEGMIRHAEVRIGEGMVMMGESGKDFTPMPTMLYIYVEDTDAAYRRALAAGGRSIKEPGDTFYGHRNAAVEDPCGNQWWMATKQEEIPQDEMQRRAMEEWK